MTDFPENEKLNSAEESTAESEIIADEYAEYDTIFGDPEAHDDKRERGAKNGKKRILALISALLAVVILVGGTVTVIKLIPEKEDEAAGASPFDDISVIDYESADLNSVTVTNPQGTFKLLSETTVTESDSSEDSESETETVWHVDGVSSDVVSSTAIGDIATAAASVTAYRTIDTKTAAECGMDEPVYKVDVTSEEHGDYSILVGSDSPDGSGTYLKLSTSDTIYVVNTTSVEGFNFGLLDLADTSSIAGITVPEGVEGYTDDSGALAAFDTLTVSGKQFSQTVKIVANDDDSTRSAFATYLVKSPTERIANNTDNFVTLFKSGLSVRGAYALDVSAASLASVGLDNPDIVATMEVAGVSRTYKFALQSDGDYAVVADDSKLIHKVNSSLVTISEYTSEDLYANWVYIVSINEVSNLTVSQGEESYSFDIVYNESTDAEETYEITHNRERINTENFQTFYQLLISVACADFKVDESLSGTPSATCTYTFSEDGSKDVVTFTKCSDTKYQYAINGKPMGKITSADYNKIFKNVRLVSEGKDVVN